MQKEDVDVIKNRVLEVLSAKSDYLSRTELFDCIDEADSVEQFAQVLHTMTLDGILVRFTGKYSIANGKRMGSLEQSQSVRSIIAYILWEAQKPLTPVELVQRTRFLSSYIHPVLASLNTKHFITRLGARGRPSFIWNDLFLYPFATFSFKPDLPEPLAKSPATARDQEDFKSRIITLEARCEDMRMHAQRQLAAADEMLRELVGLREAL